MNLLGDVKSLIKYNKVILVLALLFFMACIATAQIEFYPSYRLNANFTFIALQYSNGVYKISDNQFPDYKEDDYLRLDKITILNDSDFNSPSGLLSLKLTTPNREINSAFGVQNLQIPEIAPHSSFELIFDSVKEDMLGNVKYSRFRYKGSDGNFNYLWPQKMSDLGSWTLMADFKSNISISGSFASGYLNGDELTSLDFKVFPKIDLSQSESAQIANWIALLAFLIASSSLLLSFMLTYYKDSKKYDDKKKLIDLFRVEYNSNVSLIKYESYLPQKDTSSSISFHYLTQIYEQFDFNILQRAHIYKLILDLKKAKQNLRGFPREKNEMLEVYSELDQFLQKKNKELSYSTAFYILLLIVIVIVFVQLMTLIIFLFLHFAPLLGKLLTSLANL